jgi:UDP-hydrolysing UDP-N-acetyl-D-glucosamine 2-epimerase
VSPGEKRPKSTIYNKIPKHIGICVFNRATYSRIDNFVEHCDRSEVITYDLLLSGAILQTGFGGNYVRKKNVTKIPTSVYSGTTHDSAVITADIIRGFSEHFSNTTYDAVIVIADRFETLAVANAAALHNIPIIHFQGGEVTGNIDERVRHSVTKLADYHYCSTKLSKKYIIAMGEERERVWQTGCPSLDLIRSNNIVRINQKEERYIISMFHPNTDDLEGSYEHAKNLARACLEYCTKYHTVCYWYWPNPDHGRNELVEFLDQFQKDHSAYIRKAKNQDPVSFLKELARARMIVGNSSCGIREASFIGVPAINIGERQSIRERSWNVIDIPEGDFESIFEAMEYQHDIPRYDRSYLYGYGRAGQYAVTYLEKLELSRKGPIRYPYKAEYYQEHFGADRHEQYTYWRHDEHEKRKDPKARNRANRKQVATATSQ